MFARLWKWNQHCIRLDKHLLLGCEWCMYQWGWYWLLPIHALCRLVEMSWFGRKWLNSIYQNHIGAQCKTYCVSVIKNFKDCLLSCLSCRYECLLSRLFGVALSVVTVLVMNSCAENGSPGLLVTSCVADLSPFVGLASCEWIWWKLKSNLVSCIRASHTLWGVGRGWYEWNVNRVSVTALKEVFIEEVS